MSNTPFSFVALAQGSEEWHEFRRQHAMASETAAVMGKNPWTSPMMIAEYKRTGARQKENYAMRRGSEREPILRELVCRLLDTAFVPCVVKQNDTIFAASLDGLAEGAVLEIKSPLDGAGSKRYQLAMDGQLETHDMLQVQHQLMVTGMKTAYFAVDDGFNSPAIVSVKPDKEMHAAIRKAWKSFFDKLWAGVMPDPTDLDTVERTDADWKAAAMDYCVAKADVEAATKVLEQKKDVLVALTDAPKTRGAGVIVTRFQKAGNVNYKNVPELKGVDLEQYRSEPRTEVRVSLYFDKE